MEKAVAMKKRGGELEVAETEAEREGRDHAGAGDEGDGTAVVAPGQMGEVELQADLEHQQDEPDLRQHLHRRRGCRMKDRPEKPRSEQAEQRGSERDADDDLTHRGRLADARRQFTTETGAEHDQCQLQQGEEQQRLGLVDRVGVRGRDQIMPPLTEMIWPLM